MGIRGTVAQEHGALDVALDGTLVRRKREEQLVETPDMLPRLHGAVLLQVLREGEHQRFPLVQHVDFLPLRLGKAVGFPHGEAHEQRAGTEIDDAEQTQLPETGLDIFQ